MLKCRCELCEEKEGFVRKNGLHFPFSKDQILTLILILYITINLFSTMIPVVNEFVLCITIPIFVLIYGIFLGSFVTVTYIDPAEDNVQKRLVLAGDNVTYCSKCTVFVLVDSKHCNSCNKCISEFDHHCPWLNTCIGKKNMVSFQIFLYSTLFANLSSFIFGVLEVIAFFGDPYVTMFPPFHNFTVFGLVVPPHYWIITVIISLILNLLFTAEMILMISYRAYLDYKKKTKIRSKKFEMDDGD